MMKNDTGLETCAHDLTYDKFLHISTIVWHVFGFIGIIIGIPGHILLIIILSNKASLKEPTMLYFIAIAICELVFLIAIFWLWSASMSFIRIDPREVISCGIFYNILLGSTTLSNVFLASFSMDRSVTILHPARYRSIVTQSRIILRLILITLIVILLLIPHLFYFRYNSRTTLFLCEFSPSADHRRIRLWTLIHAIVFVSVPSLIVCIGSGILLHNRCKHKRLHKNKLSASARRIQRRSILIFLVSLWMFLSLLPTCILEILIVHKRFHDHDSHCSTRWKFYKILLNCFLALLSINYSNKFYIHVIISTTARKKLIQLITCRSDQQSTITIRMNDRNNNEQGLLSSIYQTEEKPIER